MERIRTGHLASFLKPKRDLVSEGAYEQAEELLLHLTHSRESLFEIEVYFLLKAHSLEELHQKTGQLQKEMALKGFKLFLEGQSFKKLKSGLGEIFSELIPGCTPKLSLRTHTDKTTHLRYLIPLRRSLLMESGMTFHDGHGSPIFFDPFDKSLINRNMLVTGTTGSGKSVFVNKLVHSLAPLHPVVIIDKDGSFKKTTLYHQGDVLEGGFNPLQFRDPIYLREFILSLVDEKSFNRKEKGRLLKAIKEALKTEDSSFSELLEHLEDQFNGISYYFEECKDSFNGDIISGSQILYVDIDKYPKGIIAPLIIFILEYFKSIPEREKVLVFDECWSFLKKHASYIEECFRTFRKKGSLPIAISQSLNDFKHSTKRVSDNDDELFSSITNTTHFKVIFPQELEVNNEISSFDIENVYSLMYEKGHFSECYLKTTDSKTRKIVRLYLSPLEYELFHTEDGEKDTLLKFLGDHRKYFNSNQECIDSYVRLKHGQV